MDEFYNEPDMLHRHITDSKKRMETNHYSKLEEELARIDRIS